MLDLDNTVYKVACIDKPGTFLGIDITGIVAAEARLADVAIVNKQTAPELLMDFNQKWLELHRMVTMLTYQKNRAETAYNTARNMALLECNDDAIKAKGHSKASADLRKALSELDPRVVESKERFEELSVLVSYLKGKQDAFQKGYESVKKLVGAGQLPNTYTQPEKSEVFTPTKQNITQTVEDDFDLPAGFR